MKSPLFYVDEEGQCNLDLTHSWCLVESGMRGVWETPFELNAPISTLAEALGIASAITAKKEELEAKFAAKNKELSASSVR